MTWNFSNKSEININRKKTNRPWDGFCHLARDFSRRAGSIVTPNFTARGRGPALPVRQPPYLTPVLNTSIPLRFTRYRLVEGLRLELCKQIGTGSLYGMHHIK
jgi:hypothetical protein